MKGVTYGPSYNSDHFAYYQVNHDFKCPPTKSPTSAKLRHPLENTEDGVPRTCMTVSPRAASGLLLYI